MNKLIEESKAKGQVVVSNKISNLYLELIFLVTSQGPGTSLLFGLKCAEVLFGKEKAENIAHGMLVHYNV